MSKAHKICSAFDPSLNFFFSNLSSVPVHIEKGVYKYKSQKVYKLIDGYLWKFGTKETFKTNSFHLNMDFKSAKNMYIFQTFQKDCK